MQERKLKEEILDLIECSRRQETISVKEIILSLPGKGRALILVFLSLPFCQPLQIPGLSIPFGLLIALFGIRIAFGKHIWLPKIVLSKKLPSAAVEKIADKCLKLLVGIEHLIHPRFERLFVYKFMRIWNGLLIFFLGIFLAMPFPIPFTNLSAGWSIFLISIGLSENDGVFLIVGYAAALIAITFFVLSAVTIKFIF